MIVSWEGRDGASSPPRLQGVRVEAGVLPGFHPGHQFGGDEFVPEEFSEYFGAKDFFQDVMGYFRRRMPNAVVVQQAVGGQGVDMRMVTTLFIKP